VAEQINPAVEKIPNEIYTALKAISDGTNFGIPEKITQLPPL